MTKTPPELDRITREECEAILAKESMHHHVAVRLARAHLELLDRQESREDEWCQLRDHLRSERDKLLNANALLEKEAVQSEELRQAHVATLNTAGDFLKQILDEHIKERDTLESQLEVSAANMRTVQAYAERIESQLQDAKNALRVANDSAFQSAEQWKQMLMERNNARHQATLLESQLAEAHHALKVCCDQLHSQTAGYKAARKVIDAAAKLEAVSQIP